MVGLMIVGSGAMLFSIPSFQCSDADSNGESGAFSVEVWLTK
jgi:hypothetical protein